MASRSANGAFGSLLAVIAAIGFVITASNRTGSATVPRPSGTPADRVAATTAPGTDQPGRPAHPQAARRAAPPRRATPGPVTRPTTLGPVTRPATPTNVTVVSPQGRQILSAPIDPMTAQRNPDGSWVPISPPSLMRAVWMTQSAMPAAPSTGTTAIYGHACIGLLCAFDNLVNTPPQSIVTVQTRTGALHYRVISVMQYPKAGAQSLGSRQNIANQLLLITCAYRSDGTSSNNLVLVATLIGAGSS